MAITPINFPLYRVLRALDVPEPDAEAAAAATLPDLSHFAAKDELRAEINGVRNEVAGVRADLKAEISGLQAGMRTEPGSPRTEIAQAVRRQTISVVIALAASTCAVVAAQHLAPPALSNDAVRAIVEQAVRSFQPQPALSGQSTRPVPPP